MALGLVLTFGFLSLPTAHAADRSWGNLDTAKKAIANVAPVVSSENKVDQSSASLVFASDEYIQKPLVVETQITKEPVKKVTVVKATQVKKTPVAIKAVATSQITDNSAAAHRFPYGYCTYYASSRRFVPWSGNAISWLAGARSYGFATGSTPQAGAILVTSEGGRTGHVAIVDAVNSDGTITLSEMNYRGFGVTSSRTISANYGAIMGYIY